MYSWARPPPKNKMKENREVRQLCRVTELSVVEPYIPSRSVWTL